MLFVPYHKGGFSHLIPLVALDRMLRGGSHRTAFLLPPDLAAYGTMLGVSVLPIQHQGHLYSELKAYRDFSPDVVVDDCSITTLHASTLEGIPRVTIQRVGTFPFREPCNPAHSHSMDLSGELMSNMAGLGLGQPRSIPELFAAAAKIVPGIPSVEVLPEPLRGDPSYRYSGPLLVDDYLWGASTGGGETSAGMKDFRALERFFEANRGRDVVYLTHGLIARADNRVHECMRLLLERGYAIVTSVPAEELRASHPDRLFYAYYLPLHFVCSRVKLAVHHCGSATYHYPLIHEVPSVTVGTQCYDREDVALRLQELGASRHVPAPAECGRFVEVFMDAVLESLEDAGVHAARKEVAARLHREVRETAGGFDFGSCLESGLSAG